VPLIGEEHVFDRHATLFKTVDDLLGLNNHRFLRTVAPDPPDLYAS